MIVPAAAIVFAHLSIQRMPHFQDVSIWSGKPGARVVGAGFAKIKIRSPTVDLHTNLLQEHKYKAGELPEKHTQAFVKKILLSSNTSK